MAGLSVLLESQTPSFPKCPQIISKTNLRSPPSSSSSSSHFAPTSPFLEYCYLCRQRLLEGRDIYMYRGDRAFCSEECRCKQIFLDEESVRRDSCSLAAASAATAARRRRKSRPVAGGGDRAFCSEECRCKQIFLDEESVRRDSCSLAAASAATAARRRRKSRPVAGGFA